MNEPGRLTAEDLLDRVDVADVLGRQAASGPVRGRDEEGCVVEAHDLAEIREESETDVVGVGHALAVAAHGIAGAFRSVVAAHSEAIFVPEAVPIATPVASERVGLLQAGGAPTSP